MRSLIAIAAAAALCSCGTQANRRYCDAQQSCTDPAQPFCDLVKHECGPAAATDDMAICTNSCVDASADMVMVDFEIPDQSPRCTVATDCVVDPNKPICGVDGNCRVCAANAADDQQCVDHANGKNHCKTGGGPCVECNGNSDCLAAKPICDASACRGCKAHSECPSGICAFDGSCASSNMIRVVDKNATSPTCVDATDSGTSSKPPFCEINYAINNTSGTYYLVKGGATSYGKVAFSNNTADRTIVVVGPGPTPSPTPGPATITPGGSRGIQLNVDGSHAIDITFDGFTISAATGGNGYGVDCSGGDRTKTAFRLLRSTITTNAQVGVHGSLCNVLLDEDTIGPTNGAGGVGLTDCDFSITNSLIFSNGGAGSALGGISIAGTFTTKVLSNATVVKNTSSVGVAAGIGCGVGVTVTNSILFGNTNGLVTSGNCTFDHTAFAGATATYDLTLCNPDGSDTFQNYAMDNYKLKTSGTPGCILVDKGTTPATSPMVPTTALDGTSRPQGAAWDPGALEQ